MSTFVPVISLTPRFRYSKKPLTLEKRIHVLKTKKCGPFVEVHAGYLLVVYSLRISKFAIFGAPAKALNYNFQFSWSWKVKIIVKIIIVVENKLNFYYKINKSQKLLFFAASLFHPIWFLP